MGLTTSWKQLEGRGADRRKGKKKKIKEGE